MARDLPDDLEYDHISNYEISDDAAEAARQARNGTRMSDLRYRLHTAAVEAEVFHRSDVADLFREADARVGTLEAEVERLTARITDLESLVDDLTLQSTEGMNGTLDSGALTAYAHGLHDMAKRGRVRITHDVGRRVLAELVEEPPDVSGCESFKAAVNDALAGEGDEHERP